MTTPHVLVLTDHGGAEVHRTVYPDSHRAYTALGVIRNEMRDGRRRLRIIGAIPGEGGGYEISAHRVHGVHVERAVPASDLPPTPATPRSEA